MSCLLYRRSAISGRETSSDGSETSQARVTREGSRRGRVSDRICWMVSEEEEEEYDEEGKTQSSLDR